MRQIRLLLLPFSWLYEMVLYIRNMLYNSGIIPSRQPQVKTIVLGNLALGGTGKTPHAAMILGMLQGQRVAFLSRGYGRKGKNTHVVSAADTTAEAGDEPLLIARRFPGVPVVVDSDRLRGIDFILKKFPATEVVLLDDALQHRRLRGGLNVLLTTWQDPFFNDHVLPAGNLRDETSRIKGVQAIVVSKCPENATSAQKDTFRKKLSRYRKPVFFTGIGYGNIRPLAGSLETRTASGAQPLPDALIVLVTGIANANLFAAHVSHTMKVVKHLAYPDHHPFGKSDFQRFRELIDSFAPARAVLLTTEKDAMRMSDPACAEWLKNLPVFYWEINATAEENEPGLRQLIDNYVASA